MERGKKQVFFYVRADDCVWKLSKPQMKEQLENVKNGGEFDVWAGKQVAQFPVRIEDLNETGYANECLKTINSGSAYL